ncbi:late embryogenesis abundant protein 1-like [Rhodamnia argentea]|uniref:Late embryogenesis abundant protein 1-like n=1 Tax=Rhodamnia argentea TaxID=178133 RepID=A0A8B8NSC0_9MYRT|nr:late embryogenesis abundant protein 1-like [Rhodamnia argentea]
MANQGQDIGYKAGDMIGQAQMKKEECVDQASNQYQAAMDRLSGTTPNSGYDIKGQASNFLHQTGEQVKNMAQGAAEAVKSTLGMNNNADAGNAATTVNPPNNPSYPANNPASRV